MAVPAGRLRVLVVTDVSASAIQGGAGRVLWEHARYLARGGHHVRILSRARIDDHDDPHWAAVQGIERLEFEVDRRSPLRFALSTIVGARRAALRALATDAADVLHVQQPLAGYGVLVSDAGRRVPSLYTFFMPAELQYRAPAVPVAGPRARAFARLGRLFLRRVERTCLARATRVHVLSDFSLGQLVARHRVSPDRVVKIPGGVDVERFRPADDGGRVRAELGLPAAGPVLFTLRNLEPRMAVDALLRALAIVREREPAVTLLVGGDGTQRAALEALSASLALGNHVRFLGWVREAALPRLYQAADVFVQPTRELEGFGLVTVEALACGTPVLGPDVGPAPEILRAIDPELVLSEASPGGMAAGIERLLQRLRRHPADAARLRAACRSHVEVAYSWQRCGARLEGALGRIARGGARAAGRRNGPAANR